MHCSSHELGRRVLALAVIGLCACVEGVNFAEGEDVAVGGTMASDGGIVGPDGGRIIPMPREPADDRCLPVDITQLPTCCADDEAHCVPTADIPPRISKFGR